MTVFSVRHRRALATGALELELSDRLRRRLWRALCAHDEGWTEVDETNWNYQTDVRSEMLSTLLDVLGADDLTVGGDTVDLAGFVHRASPPLVCDVVELFVGHDHAPPAASRAINDVFSQEDSPLRLLEREVVKLDGGLLASMDAEAHELMAATGFHGALRELRDARDDLMDGDVQGTIHEAGKAFESVAMGLLGASGKSGGDLVAALRQAGYFDALPDDATAAFCKQVMHAVPALRNKLGGHGQGKDIIDLPPAYGRLAVHLAAAFNLFLLELAVSRGEVFVEPDPDTSSDDVAPDYLNTAPSSASHDDIPF